MHLLQMQPRTASAQGFGALEKRTGRHRPELPQVYRTVIVVLVESAS